MKVFLLNALRPANWPWQRQRILLAAASFLPALLWLWDQHQLGPAAMFGLGVFVMLLMDNGATRLQRLEHMGVGILALIVGFFAGYFLSNFSETGWWIGLLLGFLGLGALLNAGIVLDIQLRILGLGYLAGKVPLLIPFSLLPYVGYAALWVMMLSTLFAPRTHNPFPAPAAPLWRAEWLAGRQGRFAGFGFGLALALGVACSMAIAIGTAWLNPAVAAVTTLFVLRPDHERTKTILFQRLFGVLVGCLLSFLIYRFLNDPWIFTAIATLCLCMLPKAFSSGMPWLVLNSTILLFMLLAMLGLNGHEAVVMIEDRLLDTLLGCAVACVCAYALWHINQRRAGVAPKQD